MAASEGYADRRPVRRRPMTTARLGRCSDRLWPMLLRDLSPEQRDRMAEVLARDGRRGRVDRGGLHAHR